MTPSLWRWRQLFQNLTVRNLKIKYQRSILGFVWTLLNPLLLVGVLAVVFGRVVRVPMEHYVAFLLSSYFVWNFFMQTISGATYMFTEHTAMVRSVAFPKEVLVLAGVGSRLMEFFIEMALVLAGLAVIHHHGVPAAWVWLPWLFLLQTFLALGLAYPLATLSVFYQDIEHLLPVLLTALFYVSPVFYPASLVPEDLRPYYMANPLAQLLTAYRTVAYDGHHLAWSQVAALTGVASVVFGAGYAVFRRHRADIPEVI
jgi:ABC-type polysaccharide/polyol phosphate export permease